MTTVAAAAPAARRIGRERVFYLAMAVAFTAAVVGGFGPTYFFKRWYDTPPLSGLLHLHGALFSSWLVLLLAQTALVASRRTGVHRRVGVAGGVLAAVMTVMAYFVSIDAARRGSTIPGMSPEAFLAIPLATVVVFPALVGMALWWRLRPDMHKRLMLLATAELVVAGVARLPVIATSGPLVFFGASDLFVVAMAVYDVRALGRLHRATLWGGLFLILSQIARVLLTGMPAWASIARAMTR